MRRLYTTSAPIDANAGARIVQTFSRPPSPRQHFAVLVQKATRRLDREFVDPAQQAAHGFVDVDHAATAGQIGAHRTRVQDRDCDAVRCDSGPSAARTSSN